MQSRYFKPNEIRCRCCGKIGGYPENLNKLLAALDRLRWLLGKPLIITCAYRCPKHNAEVGGVPNSFHTQDLAADFYCPGVSLEKLAETAEKAGLMGIGIYQKSGFVHGDLGTNYPRRWQES